MQWPLLLGTWGYHLPGCKDPYIPAPRVTSARNSGPFVAGRARIDPCSAPPPVTGVRYPQFHLWARVTSLGQRGVCGAPPSHKGRSVGSWWHTMSFDQATLASDGPGGLTGEISSSASLTQLSLDRGTVLHTVLGEPDTGIQAAASLRALTPPPGGMKPPRVITPQGPHPTPVRPAVLRTPLPVSYLEEEPLERLVLGRGMCPPIPRAKLSHPVCLSIGRLRHALGTGYVPPGCLPANQSTHPGPICLSRRRSKAAPIHPSLGGPSRPTGPRTASADWSARWLVGPDIKKNIEGFTIAAIDPDP
jgi:hypothetical protein